MKLTSINIFLIFAIVLFSIIALASIETSEPIDIDVETIDKDPQYWIPTEDDIAYQDSMWTIIDQTKREVDTIKESIDHILLRLEYMDGTSDSIKVPVKQ